RAQVALHVDRERLQRRDVEHPAAGLLRRHRGEHQPIDRGQEGGQRLPGARGREDERAAAVADGGPGQTLRARGRREGLPEPRLDRGVERPARGAGAQERLESSILGDGEALRDRRLAACGAVTYGPADWAGRRRRMVQMLWLLPILAASIG